MIHRILLIFEMRYLLDTNIVSDLIRFPQGRCATRIDEVGEHEVATSIIVASELRFGALKKRSAALTRQVNTVLSSMEILPFEAPADFAYAHVRAALEGAGTPIGGNDMLIAAQAVALSMIVVTDNEREFLRVPGLKVENWLSAGGLRGG